MPIYPYVCTACGHEFDSLQKISDDPLRDCPECGESGLRKRLAAPAFQLKGSGWYETDFKHSGKKKDAETGQNKDQDKSNGKGDGQGSEAKSDKNKTGAKGGSENSSGGGDSKPAAAAGGKDE